jgi:hypothetical protein
VIDDLCIRMVENDRQNHGGENNVGEDHDHACGCGNDCV